MTDLSLADGRDEMAGTREAGSAIEFLLNVNGVPSPD